MAVTRKIDEFEIFRAENSWGQNIEVSVSDPDGEGSQTIYITKYEAKQFAKELKAAIKELEGK